jgi:hypothetical protein
MKTRLLTILLVVTTAPAMAFHADIFLVQQNGALLTGRGSADPGSGGNPQVGTRFHVNDIAGLVPFVDSNPGISAENAGHSFFLSSDYQPLPGSRNVGFNLKAFRVQNRPAANLFYWSGTADVAFQPVTNLNDRLEVRTGAGSAIATGAALDVIGFDFTATSPTGAIHSHLNFDFDVDNNSATAASTGIFLAGLEFYMNLVGDAAREIARPHYVAWFNGPPGTLKSSAMAAANNYFAANFAELRLFGDVSPLGDDSLPDDLVDDADIDAMLSAVRGNSSDLLFDLNNDEVIDGGDVSTLFGVLGTEYGDANLDGSVNGADLAIWQQNYGSSGGWAMGDFDGSGKVDGRDFLVWQQHVGFTAVVMANAHAVPEPSPIKMVGFLVAMSLAKARSRKGKVHLNQLSAFASSRELFF